MRISTYVTCWEYQILGNKSSNRMNAMLSRSAKIYSNGKHACKAGKQATCLAVTALPAGSSCLSHAVSLLSWLHPLRVFTVSLAVIRN
jgi:hypothetical protein